MNIIPSSIQVDNQNVLNNTSVNSNNTPVNANSTGVSNLHGNNITNINILNNQLALIPEGQIFQGKILDITNSQVTISLDSNNVIQARMADALMLNIGDELSFQVKEKDGQNIYIKPTDIQQQDLKNNVLSKVLEQNSLSPSEKNYQIADALMKHNMPLDRNNMQKIIQQAYKFPDVSIDNLVNMNKLGIPVNESTIKQYQDMQNNNHQLLGNISDFTNKVTSFIGEFAGELKNGLVDSDSFVTNTKEILSIVSDSQDPANIEISDEMYNINSDSEPSINSNDIKISYQSETLSQKLDINKNNLEGLLNKLNEIGISNKGIENLVQKSDTPMQFINNVNELINSIATDNKENILSDIFNSKDFQSVFNEVLTKKFTVNPDEMENPQELSDLYKNIYNKTQKLLDAFSGNSGGANEQMKDSGRALQERIDFVQNLNDLFGYTQIPVNMSGNEMNSELFVYMNRNSKKDLSKEVSALLHLDMDHLGATDVHVSLNGSTVNTRFYVDDEISAKIIDEHMTTLEKALNTAGYSLTNEVVNRKADRISTNNMVVDEIICKDLEQSIKRYSFDVKM